MDFSAQFVMIIVAFKNKIIMVYIQIRRLYMFSSKKEDPFFAALLKVAKNVNEAAHYAR